MDEKVKRGLWRGASDPTEASCVGDGGDRYLHANVVLTILATERSVGETQTKCRDAIQDGPQVAAMEQLRLIAT